MSADGSHSIWRWGIGALLTVSITIGGLYGNSLEREIATLREDRRGGDKDLSELIEGLRDRLDGHELTETIGMAGRISALESLLAEPRYSRLDADRDRAVREAADLDIRRDLEREIVALERRVARLEERAQASFALSWELEGDLLLPPETP